MHYHVYMITVTSPCIDNNYKLRTHTTSGCFFRLEKIMITTITHTVDITEEKNRIASTLKLEYKDFINSLDMPMTEELGLCYRDMLEDIFKKLKKNGIDVSSR